MKVERERRVVLKDLFDNLDYWVGLGLGETSRMRIKLAYHDRIANAVECIKKLEMSLALKAEYYEKLLTYNQQLRAKLQITGTPINNGVIYSRKEPRPDRNYLYRCEVCHQVAGLSDIKMAFSHQERHHPLEGTKAAPKISFMKKGVITYKKVPESQMLSCRHCPTTTFDSMALHLHSLLHKELVLFLCPWTHCTDIFGVPSKLKRHHFLDHEVVLSSEESCRVSLPTRVNLTRYLYLSGENVIYGPRVSLLPLDIIINNISQCR